MLVHPQFDPVALHLGPVAIRWYGLMYLVGFALLLLLGRLRIKRGQGALTSVALDDLIFYGVIGTIVGGRLGYIVFYKLGDYLRHPLDVLKVWEGGMSFHGGLIGVIVAMLLFARPRKLSFFQVSDFIAPLVPLGLAAGRIGNFINGELWGRAADPSSVPWAMVFPQAGDGVPRHPSQLYEFALEGIALFILLWWFSEKPRPRGAVSGLFLIGYGLARFSIEFTREPDTFLGLLALGMSMGQWLSLPMVLIGIAMMLWAYRRNPASTVQTSTAPGAAAQRRK